MDKIRNILIKFSVKNKNVTLIFRNKNFGLKKNITLGISEIISKYKRVIVLEDDLILSRNFLLYMNSGLNFYKKKKKKYFQLMHMFQNYLISYYEIIVMIMF